MVDVGLHLDLTNDLNLRGGGGQFLTFIRRQGMLYIGAFKFLKR